jgi:recombination protein RecT
MTTTDPSPLSNALAHAEPSKQGKVSPKQLIRQAVEINRKEIQTALPAGYVGGPERFARTVLTAVARDPKLLACSPNSILGAAMQAAQLGLTPGVLGEAWLIPYKNECTFQLGVKGLVSLAARAGIGIQAHTVYDRDEFAYRLGLEPGLDHVPATGDRGKGTHWYAVARDINTGRLLQFAVLDRYQVDKRRAANRGASPAWTDWFDEMALTKAVREVCRFLPLSVEMSTALVSDGVVRTEISGAAEEYAAPFEDEDQVVDGEVVE